MPMLYVKRENDMSQGVRITHGVILVSMPSLKCWFLSAAAFHVVG